MSDYSQPEFYRFNEDSIALINFVKQYIKSARSILDLGAGSGIIGMELAKIYLPDNLSLVEYQKDFIPYLNENFSQLQNLNLHTEIIEASFGTFKSDRTFELIVSNPPYYLKGEGEASKDPRRGIARSFQHEGWSELLGCIKKSLSPEGKAFLVVKNHPRIRAEIERHLKQFQFILHEKNQIVILELAGLDKDGSEESL